MVKTERLFISVKVKQTDATASAMEELGMIRDLHVPPASQVHITLAFLGDTDVAKIPGLCSELRKEFSGFGRFAVRMKGIGAFPKIADPRVVWIGVDNPGALMEAASKTRAALERLGLDYDGKKFSPHVTIARVNGKADVRALAEKYSDTVFSEFEVSGIDVIKSELGPSGAKHTLVERIELEGQK